MDRSMMRNDQSKISVPWPYGLLLRDWLQASPVTRETYGTFAQGWLFLTKGRRPFLLLETPHGLDSSCVNAWEISVPDTAPTIHEELIIRRREVNQTKGR